MEKREGNEEVAFGQSSPGQRGPEGRDTGGVRMREGRGRRTMEEGKQRKGEEGLGEDEGGQRRRKRRGG